jgi:hypothetical protein
VYFIFALINCLSFAPITCADNSNYGSAIGKSHCKNAAIHFPEAIKAFFGLTVSDVLGNDALWIGEGILGAGKRNAVFLLIFSILDRIPIKVSICHERRLSLGNIKSHT